MINDATHCYCGCVCSAVHSVCVSICVVFISVVAGVEVKSEISCFPPGLMSLGQIQRGGGHHNVHAKIPNTI